MNTTPTTAVRACIAAMALAFGAAGASAQVLPTSPSVISGQASFSRTGNVYSITNTPGAIIQWQSFSIGAGATTRFLQQNASSAVLNRIVGQDPSQILGTLQSNGRVFLVNPNGVVFGAGSRIDVNGLVASSLALSNQDFLAGKMNFAGGATAGAVTNAGVIVTPGGGSVYLIAPSVGNSGVIQSPGGEVVLAAGRSVQLVDSASPNVHVVVSAPEDQAVNLGQILSQGGKVGIYGGLVNQGGQVSADSAVVGANGRIIFKASSDLRLEAGSVTSATGSNGGGTIEMKAARQLTMDRDAVVRADASQAGNGGTVKLLSDGLTRVYGSISARGGAVSGNGGFVETSGRRLDMQGRVDTRAPHGRTGALLLDPTNIFIANDQASATAAGMTGADLTTSGFQAENAVGDSLLTVGTLEHVLGTSMVTVSTENAAGTGAGFIRVVDPVTWVGDTSLTLLATAGIQINAPITGSLGGTLALGTTSGNISQTAPIVMPRLVAHADTGAVILTNAGNQVGQLAGFANGAGGFNFTNGASALTIGAFGTEMVFDTGITSLGAGPININTGGLTLDANVTSAAGNIAIAAGGVFENHAAIGTTSGRITLQGGVIQYSLADCTANPALTGCAAVLPTLAACTADPSLPGCSAVLPPVPVDPPEPVLPSIGACTANPSLAGCDSVLPSLASCTASPTLPGCSVVLPTLSSCTASPTLPGCSVVLPTLSSCIANPTLAGCSVVLPTLSS
jgi:filamentous hemagglutinin family protein